MFGRHIELGLCGCGQPFRGGDDGGGGGGGTDSENSFDSGAMAAASGYDGPGDSGGSGLNSENSFDTGAMAAAAGYDSGKGGGSSTDSALSEAAAQMADFDTKSTGENDKGSADWNTSALANDPVTGRSAEEQMQYDTDASAGGRNNASALNSVNQDSWNSFVNAYDQALNDGASSSRAAAQAWDVLSSMGKGAASGAKSGGIAGAILGATIGAGKGAYDVSSKDYSKAEEAGKDSARQSMTEALNSGNWGQPGAASVAANGIGSGPGNDGSNGSNGGSGASGGSGVASNSGSVVAGAVTPASTAAATGVIQARPVATGITASGNLIPLAEQIWWKRSGS